VPLLTEEHSLERVQGEYWGWYERGGRRNNWVDKNIIMCCDHRVLFKKNQRCATLAGHVAGTETVTS